MKTFNSLCCLVIFNLIAFFVQSREVSFDEDDSSRLLSRRRRYVTFPEGASFSMATCMTVGVMGNPMPGIYTWGLNWGISYGLPNQTQSIMALKKLRKLPRPIIARRFRRDLYSKLELIINDMGYHGRECIFRSLCEASQRLMPRGNSLIEELFKKIFTLPSTQVMISEPTEDFLYDEAHKNGYESQSCQEKYRNCPFSLLDLALGYHTPKKAESMKFQNI